MTPEELNRALAEAAGWRQDGPIFKASGEWWRLPAGPNNYPVGQLVRLPDFANSIDAQHRWIDPLVEAKHYALDELHLHFGTHGRRVRLGEQTADAFLCLFVGDGPSYAHARAEALLAALQ